MFFYGEKEKEKEKLKYFFIEFSSTSRNLLSVGIESTAPTPSPVSFIYGDVSSIGVKRRDFYGTSKREFYGEIIDCGAGADSCLVECSGESACERALVKCSTLFCGIRCIGDGGGINKPCENMKIVAQGTSIVEILCLGKDSCGQMNIDASYGLSYRLSVEGKYGFSRGLLDIRHTSNLLV